MPVVQIKRVVEEVKEFPDIGAAIKKARKNDGRPMTELCQVAKVSRSYWYQLEKEDLRAPATEEIIRRIEKALDVSLGVDFDAA
jgi:transcriptional regulator with XRE-family HTH domain